MKVEIKHSAALSEKSVQCVLSHTSTVRFSYGTKIAKDMFADYKFIQFTPLWYNKRIDTHLGVN